MKKSKQLVVGFSVMTVISLGIAVYAFWIYTPIIGEYNIMGRPAKIHPDYSGIVIPSNIAPLNFVVEEEGSYYCLKIHSLNSQPITIFSRSPKIEIPLRPWRNLLVQYKGQSLYFDIYVKTQGSRWDTFTTITNQIATEDIDPWLVFRNIHPGYNMTYENEICQRNIENYRQSVVLSNRSFYGGQACMNCHTFRNNNADLTAIHFRDLLTGKKSMLLIEDGKLKDVDSRSQFGGSAMGHSAWHPSGKMIVFTVYKIQQFFHTAQMGTREGMDIDSAMGYYQVDSGQVKTSPAISKEDRLETYPAWSPDGRYLYFCSAPLLWDSSKTILPENYNQVKYDLIRVSYDINTDTWGQPETVLSAKDTGRSILLPRISPDGRWLLFCMCGYSAWPGFQADSDLYMIDLQEAAKTGLYEYRPLEQVNSNQADYWHSWSANSRWFVFSSKRGDGIFTKPYFSYVDENGIAHKPFVLPQKDADFYDSFIKAYQLPELVANPIPVTGEALAKTLRLPVSPSKTPVTSATPAANPPRRKEHD